LISDLEIEILDFLKKKNEEVNFGDIVETIVKNKGIQDRLDEANSLKIRINRKLHSLGIHEFYKGNDMKTRCRECNAEFALGRSKQ